MARRIARAASSLAALQMVCAVAGAQVPGERPPAVSLEVGDETAQTQSAICGEPSGTFRTNQVIVRGRWAGKVDLPLEPGEPLTAENASAALNKLREEISNHSSDRYFNSVGEVHVLKVSGECGTPQPDGSVDFILQPRYVGLSAVRIGDNVLPIPRWREPAPYDEIPPLVRTLLPAFGAAYDDVSGTSLTAAINPTLFHQPRTASSPVERDLTAQIAATHSLDESLYSDAARLTYTRQKSSDLLRGVTLSMHYAREREPLGDRRHDSDSRGAAAGAMLKLRPNTRLYVDAGYDRQHEELSASATAEKTAASEDQTSMRVLFEAIPPSMLGFARASLWANDADGYQRLVARMAYSKEWSLRPNQTVGVEMTVGAGRAWGDVPEYARFRGGSARQEFLYDGASSATMLEMPEGPTLRSFGEECCGLAGRHSGDARSDALLARQSRYRAAGAALVDAARSQRVGGHCRRQRRAADDQANDAEPGRIRSEFPAAGAGAARHEPGRGKASSRKNLCGSHARCALRNQRRECVLRQTHAAAGRRWARRCKRVRDLGRCRSRCAGDRGDSKVRSWLLAHAAGADFRFARRAFRALGVPASVLTVHGSKTLTVFRGPAVACRDEWRVEGGLGRHPGRRRPCLLRSLLSARRSAVVASATTVSFPANEQQQSLRRDAEPQRAIVGLVAQFVERLFDLEQIDCAAAIGFLARYARGVADAFAVTLEEGSTRFIAPCVERGFDAAADFWAARLSALHREGTCVIE